MDKSSIGDKLRLVRKQRGLTQKQLGELCGIDEANIRKYELGKQKPRLDTLERISDALGISQGYFGTFWTSKEWAAFDKTKTDVERDSSLAKGFIDVLYGQTKWVEDALIWTTKVKSAFKIDVVSTAKAINECTKEEFSTDYFHVIQNLIYCFEQLNEDGQRKLFEHLKEILENPSYLDKEE